MSSGSGGGGGGGEESSKCCFYEWMKQQERDLSELDEAIKSEEETDKKTLTKLIEKMISHFERYIEQRLELSEEDPTVLFAPTWCTPLENSLLWIAGCRPSSYFRLLFAINGFQIESKLSDFLTESNTNTNTDRWSETDLSGNQVRVMDELQRKTIKEEEKLTNSLALLQEDVADQPVAIIVKCSNDDIDNEINKALDEHERSLAKALNDADKLRLSTLNNILSILTPFQAVDFLAMSKKLHLSIHKWSKIRDQRHGRSR